MNRTDLIQSRDDADALGQAILQAQALVHIKTITNESRWMERSFISSGLFGSDDSDAGRLGNLLDLNVSRT
jgi:hypothetical protein